MRAEGARPRANRAKSPENVALAGRFQAGLKIAIWTQSHRPAITRGVGIVDGAWRAVIAAAPYPCTSCPPFRAALEPQPPANLLSDVPRWPDADTMFEGAWRPDWRRRAKYMVRLALTVSARRRVLAVCASNDLARTLLGSRPRAFYR